MSGVDILICAEDPGAANFLAPLPGSLEAGGLSSHFLAHPRIGETLDSRGVIFEPIDGMTSADDLIIRHRPGMLLAGTSEFADCLGLQLIDASRRAGMPSGAVVDMAANVNHRFRGYGEDALSHAPDWLGVCDKATGDGFTALGFPAEHIVVCGHPHFDVVRERRAAFEGEDRAALRRRLVPDAGDRKVVVFVAEGVDQLNPAFSSRARDYSLAGRGDSDYRTAIVLEELLDAMALLDPKPYIVVRLHPKNDPAEFAAYRDEIDQLSSGGDPLPLLWAADVAVGMTSMLLVEAYLLACPTLAVLPRGEEAELIVTTANGLTPVVTTAAELRENLPVLLEHNHAEFSDSLPEGALECLINAVKLRLRETGHSVEV